LAEDNWEDIYWQEIRKKHQQWKAQKKKNQQTEKEIKKERAEFIKNTI
jgi:hypothetical protein